MKLISMIALHAAALGVLCPAARAQIGMPDLSGFEEVAPGTALKMPDRAPSSRPAGMTMNARAYDAPEPNVVSLSLTGRVLPGAVSTGGQHLAFESEEGGESVDIALNLPFVLRDLIPGPMEGSLRYRSLIDPVEYNRIFNLSFPGDERFLIVQLGGYEPAVLNTRRGDTDFGIRGLSIRQGAAEASAREPSHDYTYPVPVTVETADGTVTSLWQGQWVRLPGGLEGQRVHLIVLASEVAKPRGKVIHGFEGAPFTLELLLVTQSR